MANTNPSNPIQTQAVTENNSGGASHVTAEGHVVSSNDQTTRPDASIGEKLKGNTQGALHGTLGSIQATAGAALKNKGLEEKGLEKMQEEDQRLGAKRGVLPVGSDQRNIATDATNTRTSS